MRLETRSLRLLFLIIQEIVRVPSFVIVREGVVENEALICVQGELLHYATERM